MYNCVQDEEIPVANLTPIPPEMHHANDKIGGKGSWVDRAAEVRRGQNMRKRICHSAMSDGDRFGSDRGAHPYHNLEDWLVPSERCKKAYWCPANGDVLVDHVQYLLGAGNTEVRLIHGV